MKRLSLCQTLLRLPIVLPEKSSKATTNAGVTHYLPPEEPSDLSIDDVFVPGKYKQLFNANFQTEVDSPSNNKNTIVKIPPIKSAMKNIRLDNASQSGLEEAWIDHDATSGSRKNDSNELSHHPLAGKKLAKIEENLDLILQEPRFANMLHSNIWRVTSITLSSNESTCNVWWTLVDHKEGGGSMQDNLQSNGMKSDMPKASENKQDLWVFVQELLDSHHSLVQRALYSRLLPGKRVNASSRYLPRLVFRRDKTFDVQMKLDRIFADLVKQLN